MKSFDLPIVLIDVTLDATGNYNGQIWYVCDDIAGLKIEGIIIATSDK